MSRVESQIPRPTTIFPSSTLLLADELSHAVGNEYVTTEEI